MRLCIITCPLGQAPGPNLFVYEFINILKPLTKELFLITNNYPSDAHPESWIHVRNIKHDAKKQFFILRGFKQVFWQLKIAAELIRIARRVDMVVFYLGSISYILPTLAARIWGKKIVSVVTGSASKSAQQLYAGSMWGWGGKISHRVMGLFEKVNYRLASLITVESVSLVEFLDLSSYKHKVQVAGVYFNTGLFAPRIDFVKRENVVGFVGRLSPEKGILNFMQAISLIQAQNSGVSFIIGGDGSLFPELQEARQKMLRPEQLFLTGWISHEQLVNWYNRIKLLIVPSYTESIPIVAMEAMACGTVVLATPVGGTPDIVKNGENGFLLKDNSAPGIAAAVLALLDNPRLPEVSQAARKTVESGCSYEAATQKYREILARVFK